MSGIVRLQSSDGKIIAVPEEVATQSPRIQKMLQELREEDGGADLVVLHNVTTTVLEKVVQWYLHQEAADYLVVERIAQKGLSPWETEFFEVDFETRRDLGLAAIHLELGGFLTGLALFEVRAIIANLERMRLGEVRNC